MFLKPLKEFAKCRAMVRDNNQCKGSGCGIYLEEEGDGGGRVLDAITDMHLIFWQVLCRLWQEVLRMLQEMWMDWAQQHYSIVLGEWRCGMKCYML